jgi:hypothetical protein
MSDWKSTDLCGAGNIERVCNTYEIYEHGRVPGGYFKIKVMESQEGNYEAVANLRFKSPDGSPHGWVGTGDSEAEALQDCLRLFMAALGEREEWAPEDFCWSDPVRF